MADRTSGGMFFGPAIILAVLAAVGIGPSLGHQRDQSRQSSAPAVASQKKAPRRVMTMTNTAPIICSASFLRVSAIP